MSAIETANLREFELSFTGVRPVTINWVARQHRQAWAQHTRETRRVWKTLAREARIPRLAKAGITVVPLHVNRKSMQDAAAAAPEAKAAIDGLVDAGILADDGPEYVSWVHFTAPRVCGHDGMLIRIHELA